ncbi:MAG: acetyl-CoA carboxylase biotin carboxyl carrier protein subunit [Candidatus Wallbacteria bacterium]
MDFNTIKNFVKFLKESRYSEFKLKNGDTCLKIKFEKTDASHRQHGIDTTSMKHARHGQNSEAGEKSQNSENNGSAAKGNAENEFVKIITSPLVGRFYSTMTADRVKQIRKGDHVQKGQKICMIEAMNIEHEISSPYSGILEETLIDDGDSVMYGQELFKIRLANQ